MERFYRVATRATPRLRRRSATGELVARCSTATCSTATRPATRSRRPDGASVLAPVRPSKIVCVGLNYKDHAAELEKPLPAEPLLFIKPSTAVHRPRRRRSCCRRRRPRRSRGRARRRHRPAGAPRAARPTRWDYVFGLTCVNDVTARDLQNKERAVHARQGLRHVRADRPVHRDRLDDQRPPASASKAGSTASAGRTRRREQLIFPIDYLVEYITFVMTLEPATSSPPARRPASARCRPATW